MILSPLSQPNIEPVSIEDLKAILPADLEYTNETLSAAITKARQLAENFTQRPFISRQWRVLFEGKDMGKPLYLPAPELREVLEAQGRKAGGAWESISFVVKAGEDNQKDLFMADGAFDEIQVAYSSGYGDMPAEVPAQIREAIKLLAVQMCMSSAGQEIVVHGTPYSLLSQYRVKNN